MVLRRRQRCAERCSFSTSVPRLHKCCRCLTHGPAHLSSVPLPPLNRGWDYGQMIVILIRVKASSLVSASSVPPASIQSRMGPRRHWYRRSSITSSRPEGAGSCSLLHSSRRRPTCSRAIAGGKRRISAHDEDTAGGSVEGAAGVLAVAIQAYNARCCWFFLTISFLVGYLDLQFHIPP